MIRDKYIHVLPASEAVERAAELISLKDMALPIWQSRWSVLLITLLFVVCGLSWTWLNPGYKSEGFFQFSAGIPFADFKRYSAAYETGERFNDYVQDKKLNSAPGVDRLREIFSSRTGISRVIEPVYPFTKRDAKELMAPPKDNSNNVIGLRISDQSGSPEIARQMVDLLGRYVMDSIVYCIYSDMLQSRSSEITARMMELDNAVIDHNVRLEKYRRKVANLKQIIARNPQSIGLGSRQVVQVTEDSARYLPPATLLIATEMQVSETNEAVLKISREQLQNKLLLDYYDRLKTVLNKTKSGETILHSLEPTKTDVFNGKDLKNDTIKEVYNTISADNQRAISRYLKQSRFIAGPTLPGHTTTRLSVVLTASLMLGLLMSGVFVFGRHWWRTNQAEFSH